MIKRHEQRRCLEHSQHTLLCKFKMQADDEAERVDSMQADDEAERVDSMHSMSGVHAMQAALGS